MMRVEAVVAELVRLGLDDVIQASEAAYVSTYTIGAKTDTEVRESTVEAVRLLLQRGLMEIGDIVSVRCPQAREGHILDVASWGLSPPEAAARVDREWRALGRRPNLGELFWLRNTALGNQMGQSLFDEYENVQHEEDDS